MTRYESYVICTSPRSGSTLLCKLLASTGITGKPESYFHNPSIAEWADELGLRSQDSLSRRDRLNAIFDAVLERGRDTTAIFGLRVQRHSFNFLTEQMRLVYPGLSNDVELFEAAFGRTLFIHLSRANKLEQAISLVKATQTGLWHMAPDGTEIERLSAPREPVYNADAIANELAELTDLEQEWIDWFDSESVTPLRLTYDELSADPTAVVRRVLDQLGLDTKAAEGITPTVAKLADATSQDWMARFLDEQGSS